MAYRELKAKYPEIHHAPREGCKYCGGTGEKVTHLKKTEFFEETMSQHLAYAFLSITSTLMKYRAR